MNILLGVTGSSSAKLVWKIVDALLRHGHDVRCVFTQSAEHIMNHGDDSYNEWILGAWRKGTKIQCLFDVSEWDHQPNVWHVELAEWADRILVAPCTSNTMQKIRYGFSDNLLTSAIRAFVKEKIYVAPSMNTNMLSKCFEQWNGVEDEMISLFPTRKMLTCGTYGLGALADIGDIANIVSGNMWAFPVARCSGGLFLRDLSHPSLFGVPRKHDVHAGVDLYVDRPGTWVHACEDGEVVSTGIFTGEEVGSSWWNTTHYMTVLGSSGKIVYGEMSPKRGICVGSKVKKGEMIGYTERVLKHPPKEQVIGHRMDMLHIELLDKDAPCNFVECWKLGEDRPKWLKDPSVYLF